LSEALSSGKEGEEKGAAAKKNGTEGWKRLINDLKKGMLREGS